jgi:uncharacterized RDD family membrane protein YckC
MLLHEVMTTEKVPFNYRVAGLGSRFLAWLVDVGLMVLLTVAGLLVGGVLNVGRFGLGLAVVTLWTFALQWGYFLFFEWLWHGQTPGKRLVGIRVIDWRGTSVSFGQAAIRNLLRAVDSLPMYGVAFVVAACNREQRRLGDLAANTLVVHVERRAKPIRALHDGATEADAARDALFRQRLSQFDRRQKQALLDLCLRRDQLRVDDRARLFRELAEYFKTRLELAPAQYQSEEKFILEVAGVLGERNAPEADLYARGMPWKRKRR